MGDLASTLRGVKIGLVAAVLLLAACSSSTGGGPKKEKKFTTRYGMDAVTIAGHIDGCQGVVAEGAGGLLPGVVSAADCTLGGHRVVVYGWRDAAAQTAVSVPVYAEGVGWTAFVGDSAAASVQRSAAVTVAGSLGGKVVG